MPRRPPFIGAEPRRNITFAALKKHQPSRALAAVPLCSEKPYRIKVFGTALAAFPLSAHGEAGGKYMQKLQQWRRKQEGKLGYILLWALGVPIPVLFVIFLLRGCN
jgi:hypothetical protein